MEGHDGKSMFPGGMKPCHEECQTHDNREENGFAFLPHFDIYLVEFLLKEQRTFFLPRSETIICILGNELRQSLECLRQI